MGRAGIEPATLGLKVDHDAFGCSREGSETRLVERNQLEPGRPDSRAVVDPALTRRERAREPAEAVDLRRRQGKRDSLSKRHQVLGRELAFRSELLAQRLGRPIQTPSSANGLAKSDHSASTSSAQLAPRSWNS
jgi:hypothetical protein